MTSFVRAVVVSYLLMLAGTKVSLAHEVKAGDLLLTQLWSRATPPGAKVGAAYLTIENKGTTPDRLISVTSASANAAIHEMTTTNGVMTMRPLEAGLTIPVGQTVTLAPGGVHVMMTDLKTPLKQGEMLPLTLQFEKAGKVETTFHILGVGAQGPAAAGQVSGDTASSAASAKKM